jgi:adenylate cyclase
MLPSIASCTASTADARSEIDVEVSLEDCSSTDIYAELQRIAASPHFEASERNRRFLKYVIDETLAGRAGRIKAYNIATEVFGRDVNFDPQLDPVVRMEARRLRRSLERVYLTDGRSSRVRIAMPKGGYVPEFRNTLTLTSSPSGFAQPSGAGDISVRSRAASIAVARFDAEGDKSIFVHFNHGFTDEIMVGLSRYPELTVFDLGTLSRNARTSDPRAVAGESAIDFVLAGSVALFEGALDVKAVLVHARTGEVLWGQSFERRLEAGKIPSLRDEIANVIVRAVAEPFGVIFHHTAAPDPERATEMPGATRSVRQFHQYRRCYRRDLFSQTRLSLEQTVTAGPEDSEATACLSLIYTDAHRFGFASSEAPAALRQQAAGLARRAIEIDPYSSRGHHAQGLADWFLNDVPASMKAMQTAVVLNPNASDTLADLGLLWALQGHWSRAVPLLEAVRDRKTLHSALHTGLSLHHFVNDRFEDALAEALEIDVPDVAYGFVTRAISQIRLGRKTEAADSVHRIMALALTRPRGGLTELGSRNVHSDLAKRVSAALHDAGLPQEFLGD